MFYPSGNHRRVDVVGNACDRHLLHLKFERRVLVSKETAGACMTGKKEHSVMTPVPMLSILLVWAFQLGLAPLCEHQPGICSVPEREHSTGTHTVYSCASLHRSVSTHIFIRCRWYLCGRCCQGHSLPSITSWLVAPPGRWSAPTGEEDGGGAPPRPSAVLS